MSKKIFHVQHKEVVNLQSDAFFSISTNWLLCTIVSRIGLFVVRYYDMSYVMICYVMLCYTVLCYGTTGSMIVTRIIV